MKESNSLLETLRVILAWRKALLIVTLCAFILSIIISFLLPVYYKSTEIFYPYSLEYLNPKNIINETETEIYGTNEDVDRLLQIGNSSQLTGYIVRKYDLYKRYDINPSDKLASFNVSEKFKDNYKIIKNEKGAIEVSMMDTDPDVAANITKEITHFIDSINLKPIIETSSQQLSILHASLLEKQDELLKLDSSISNTKNKNRSSVQSISPSTLIESQKIGAIDTKVTEKLMTIINLNQQYSQIDKIIKSNFKSISIIEEATPSVKKAKPVRWLIVAASTTITLFFSIIFILLIEFYRSNIRALLRDE